MKLWLIYALLSAMFAAIVPIISKKAFIDLSSLDSTLATTVRAISMAIFLIIVSIILGKSKLYNTITSRALLFIVFSGIAGALSWLCYFLAIKVAPKEAIPSVAALDKLSVVFVLIFAVTFLGDKLTVYSALGAILLTMGSVLMTIK